MEWGTKSLINGVGMGLRGKDCQLRFMHGLKIRNDSWPLVTFQQQILYCISQKSAGTLISTKWFIVRSTFPGNL